MLFFLLPLPIFIAEPLIKERTLQFPLVKVPTAHRSLPYSSLTIHLSLFTAFPVRKEKESVLFLPKY
jgi:hypothetical protein